MDKINVLAEALKTFKKECNSHYECFYCPFWLNEKCQIVATTPRHWNLIDVSYPVKLFNDEEGAKNG